MTRRTEFPRVNNIVNNNNNNKIMFKKRTINQLKSVIQSALLINEMIMYRGGPTEGACSMTVPAMSIRHRTSALGMPSTHPAIRNPNHQ